MRACMRAILLALVVAVAGGALATYTPAADACHIEPVPFCKHGADCKGPTVCCIVIGTREVCGEISEVVPPLSRGLLP